MLRALCISVSFLVALPVQAQNSVPLRADTRQMLDAIGMDESIDIMVEAGMNDARGLEADLFPGRGGASWRAVVDRLYTQEVFRGTFDAAFPEDRLSPEDAAAITAFFSSDLGQRIVEGELTAWRAITDPEVESAANEAYFQRLTAGDPRLNVLDRFTAANGFVDYNVMGALNSNVAFLRGMSDGGAYEQEVSEDMILSQAWQQEPEIRDSTLLWLNSYQLMAYSALTDAEMEQYIAFSESEAGQAYTAVLFTGYDAVFTAMSYRLGLAAATFMTGEPL